jgi:hypothetical protein
VVTPGGTGTEPDEVPDVDPRARQARTAVVTTTAARMRGRGPSSKRYRSFSPISNSELAAKA